MSPLYLSPRFFQFKEFNFLIVLGLAAFATILVYGIDYLCRKFKNHRNARR
jgi:hypothetical protein